MIRIGPRVDTCCHLLFLSKAFAPSSPIHMYTYFNKIYLFYWLQSNQLLYECDTIHSVFYKRCNSCTPRRRIFSAASGNGEIRVGSYKDLYRESQKPGLQMSFNLNTLNCQKETFVVKILNTQHFMLSLRAFQTRYPLSF